MQSISNAFKDFTLNKRMYFASDSTKAALPSLVDYRADTGVDDAIDSWSDYERGYSDGYEDAKEIYALGEH